MKKKNKGVTKVRGYLRGDGFRLAGDGGKGKCWWGRKKREERRGGGEQW